MNIVESKDWLSRLSWQYEKIKNFCPAEPLIIIFDIDGTILDMRYMILYVLKSFDKYHKTCLFKNLTISDIAIHENQIEDLLRTLLIPQSQREEVSNWYVKHRWSSNSIIESHRPFEGVMEVIRWFQIQPDTYVGLNTGRPEVIRSETLKSLNSLGKQYKVNFSTDLLYMNPYGWEANVNASKTEGIRHFQRKDYRVFAYIDNEPENLMTVSEQDISNEILLLHANTIFESKCKKLPSNSISGERYDITQLIHEKNLPRHIHLVWHGVNDETNLRQFATSNVQWAELDVRLNPMDDQVILRHDSFEEIAMKEDEDFLLLTDTLSSLAQLGRSIKLDLKQNGILLDKVLDLLQHYCAKSSDLWFNGNIEVLKEEGFQKLAKAYPEAIIQCPIDFLIPMINSIPEKAREILNLFHTWGINRFSINWRTPEITLLLHQLDQWDFEVNIYNVPNLESFLKAILLQPKSITSDFNFPRWHYFGRGSGQDGQYHEYLIA